MNPVPQLRDLSFLAGLLPPNFRPSEVWEIPVIRDDDIVWSIVLGYLNTYARSNKQDVTSRIKCLLKRRKIKKSVRNCVEKYNPFFSKSRCICDDLMIEMVETFKDQIDDFCEKHPNFFPGTNWVKLKASSFLLSCNIVLLTEAKDENGTKGWLVKIFPDGKSMQFYGESLVIFGTLRETLGGEYFYESFSFCIPKALGLEKQKMALREILTKAKITELEHKTKRTIREICALPDIRENFIISLIKSDFVESISFIYKSPYVLSKLRDAKFEIDPRTVDAEGKSALFHALTLTKTDLLYFLYDQAANNCFSTENTIRSPDPIIVENLLCIKGDLTSLREKLKSSPIKEVDKCLVRLDELCRFNEFQTEVCRNVFNVRQRINYYSDPDTDKLAEAEQRKAVILFILQNYEKYFNWTEDINSSSDKFSLFQTFYQHSDYFNNLDFCSAIMFFDNLFLLKDRLELPDKRYSKIESQFFFFIYCRKYFEVDKSNMKSSALIVSRMITFQERLALKQNLTCFKNCLEEEEITRENAKQCMPKNVVRTLEDLPQIYGEFLLFRLQHYLDAATTVTIGDTKAVFVIERALQVLGECVKDSDFKSVQKVLSSSMPKDLRKDLKQIRNALSHLKPVQLPYRNIAEENIKLFAQIQSEMKILKSLLAPIFSSHAYTIETFVLLLTLKAVRRSRNETISEKHISHLKAILPPDTELLTDTKDLKNEWENYFRDIYSSLQMKLKGMNQNCCIFRKNNIEWYHYVTNNLISAVADKLSEVKLKCNNITEEKDSIDNYFWSLEFLLTYFVKDKLFINQRRKLLKVIENRRSFFQKYEDSGKQTKTSRTHQPMPENTADSYLPKNQDAPNLKKGDSVLLYKYNSPDSDENGLSLNDTQNSETQLESDGTMSNLRDNAEINLPTEAPKDASVALIEVAKNALSDYQSLIGEVFVNSNLHYNEDKTLKFPNIEKFRLILKGKVYLNRKEERIILKSVPLKFKDIHTAKENVKGFLEGKVDMSEEEISEEISKLNLIENERKEVQDNLDGNGALKSLEIISKVKDHFKDLEVALTNNEIDKKKFDLLCKKLELSEKAKDILSKIVKGQNLKLPGNQLDFLRNRIQHLKYILIDDNEEIKHLWETAKSERKKAYLHERIVQIYLTDPEVQASVEMLLFDCMNILQTNDLKKLWHKTSNLFNGIYLRNVLAHGNPLLESLGRFLDPYDLPSELVKKMLKLVSDGSTINYISELYQKTGNKFTEVSRIMNDDDEGFEDLRKKIKDCDYWQAFVYLLPFSPECDDS